MNWDFIGRRPLSGSDYVISVEEGPHLWNHVSKVCRVLMRRNYIDEKSEVKTSIFGQISPNLDSPNFWHVIWQLGTILYFLKVGVNLLKPHNHWPAGVGGSWNPKNHWISPRYSLYKGWVWSHDSGPKTLVSFWVIKIDSYYCRGRLFDVIVPWRKNSGRYFDWWQAIDKG